MGAYETGNLGSVSSSSRDGRFRRGVAWVAVDMAVDWMGLDWVKGIDCDMLGCSAWPATVEFGKT